MLKVMRALQIQQTSFELCIKGYLYNFRLYYLHFLLMCLSVEYFRGYLQIFSISKLCICSNAICFNEDEQEVEITFYQIINRDFNIISL